MHAYALGVPLIDPTDAAARPAAQLTQRDLAVAKLSSSDDLALLNAVLELEHEQRERDFATLERLLAYAQFDEGDLDERLYALPTRAFANAAICCIALGWIA